MSRPRSCHSGSDGRMTPLRPRLNRYQSATIATTGGAVGDILLNRTLSLCGNPKTSQWGINTIGAWLYGSGALITDADDDAFAAAITSAVAAVKALP